MFVDIRCCAADLGCIFRGRSICAVLGDLCESCFGIQLNSGSLGSTIRGEVVEQIEQERALRSAPERSEIRECFILLSGTAIDACFEIL